MTILDSRDGDANQQRAHPAAAAESRDEVHRIGTILASAFFWSYTHMLFFLGSILSDLEAYFFSCPCHPERAEALLKSGVSELYDSNTKRVEPCIMSGRMGPPTAAGEWKRVFTRPCRYSITALATCVTSRSMLSVIAMFMDLCQY